jgi:hypothetical protein
VIAVSERTVGRIYADVTAAARTLSDKEFDLRIIIDGSPNSIAPELKNTTRECVIQIERMERTMIENIEEFTSLMSFLKKEQIDDGVWEVFGGTPTLYIQLADIVVELKKFNYQSDAIKVYIQNFMYSYLLKSFNGILMQNSHNNNKTINEFRQHHKRKIPLSEFDMKGLILDCPNKTFRMTEETDDHFVVPTTPAVDLIIRENVNNAADVKQLWKNYSMLQNKIFLQDFLI